MTTSVDWITAERMDRLREAIREVTDAAIAAGFSPPEAIRRTEYIYRVITGDILSPQGERKG